MGKEFVFLLAGSSKGIVTGGVGSKVLGLGPVRDDRGGPRQMMRGNVAVHGILSGGTNARRVKARQRAHEAWGEVSTRVLIKSRNILGE